MNKIFAKTLKPHIWDFLSTPSPSDFFFKNRDPSVSYFMMSNFMEKKTEKNNDPDGKTDKVKFIGNFCQGGSPTSFCTTYMLQIFSCSMMVNHHSCETLGKIICINRPDTSRNYSQ